MLDLGAPRPPPHYTPWPRWPHRWIACWAVCGDHAPLTWLGTEPRSGPCVLQGWLSSAGWSSGHSQDTLRPGKPMHRPQTEQHWPACLKVGPIRPRYKTSRRWCPWDTADATGPQLPCTAPTTLAGRQSRGHKADLCSPGRPEQSRLLPPAGHLRTGYGQWKTGGSAAVPW